MGFNVFFSQLVESNIRYLKPNAIIKRLNVADTIECIVLDGLHSRCGSLMQEGWGEVEMEGGKSTKETDKQRKLRSTLEIV